MISEEMRKALDRFLEPRVHGYGQTLEIRKADFSEVFEYLWENQPELEDSTIAVEVHDADGNSRVRWERHDDE